MPKSDNSSTLAGDGAERLVVANWKMNGSAAQNGDFFAALQSNLANASCHSLVRTVICPPFVYLREVAQALDDSGLELGAQDVSVHDSGAYTGEISAQMLLDASCQWVIVGHSERRQYHAESSEITAAKARQAIAHGLRPIVCVGESLEDHRSGRTLDVIESQLAPVWELGANAVRSLVVAYEPVWAIGSGLTATPEEAQKVHAHIRSLAQANNCASMPLLYGGSVKADNASGLFAMQDIDGALVGGASLDPREFASIITAE